MANDPDVPLAVVQNLSSAVAAAALRTLSGSDRVRLSLELARQIRVFDANPDHLGVWDETEWTELKLLGQTLCSMLAPPPDVEALRHSQPSPQHR